MNMTNVQSTDLPRTAQAGPCVNLLWTGGWDSTFRLLQLLLLHRVAVAPHYLEDPTRASTQIELETMARIADQLRVAEEGGRLIGYAAAWPNMDTHVVGPLIARDTSVAQALIASLVRETARPAA